MDPNDWVILAYGGVPAHRDLPIPSPYVHRLCPPPCPLDIVATIKADISCPEIQRCMDNRTEAKALKISLWSTQQLLEALLRNIDSVAAANGILLLKNIDCLFVVPHALTLLSTHPSPKTKNGGCG